MSARFAPLAAALVFLVAPRCAAPTAVAPSPAPPQALAPTPATAPTPTPVSRTEAPTPPLTGATRPRSTPARSTARVAGRCSASSSRATGPVDVTLEDAAARAWRVVVAGTGGLFSGTGSRSSSRRATSDRSSRRRRSVDGRARRRHRPHFYGEDTAAAGELPRTLDVCVDSSSFTFADDGTGRLRIRLNMPDPASGALTITGGTAGWPAEPFVLGPWSDAGVLCLGRLIRRPPNVGPSAPTPSGASTGRHWAGRCASRHRDDSPQVRCRR